jgi:hypothetical protein
MTHSLTRRGEFACCDCAQTFTTIRDMLAHEWTCRERERKADDFKALRRRYVGRLARGVVWNDQP